MLTFHAVVIQLALLSRNTQKLKSPQPLLQCFINCTTAASTQIF